MSDKEKKHNPGVSAKVISGNMNQPYTVIKADRIEKSDKSEQLDNSSSISASEWIPQPVDLRGLKALVSNSTILPQCINAYRRNITGFGISVHYNEDYDEETSDMKKEWDTLQKIIELLNFDKAIKEVFEDIIEARETYGIAYAEIVRNMSGEVVELEFIKNTPSIEMTYPTGSYVDVSYFYKGDAVTRKKKFRKFRQTVAGKTVYFKEFGDPRIMDKTSGEYAKEGEHIDIDNQANELIDFKIGSEYYGEVRWLGQVLTVDGNRRAEVLNNNYFRKGRHTPLLIAINGGTLTEESYAKLNEYMSEIEGEKGQHAFIILETDNNETTTNMTESEKPTVEIKDLASILQKDELFQEYQENGRKKTQSSFLLPDLYVGYTTDFNRATAQTAMEVTEKQVFQPERASLEWTLNNKILNEYAFKYVHAEFNAPEITNPDDIQKILNITERAGGLPTNVAKDLTYKTLGLQQAEPYPEEWGDMPLAYLTKQSQPVTDDIMNQINNQITKAEQNRDDELLPIMKAIRKTLLEKKVA